MSDEDRSRVDCHVKILDERVVRRAKRAGLDAIVYAPHFTRIRDIRARADRFSDEELTVVPAREVFTGSWRERKHVLAIGLTDPVPDFITLEAAMAEFERQDAVVLAPHPEFATVSLEEADLREYRELIDGIETYNPKHLPSHNRRARQLATDLELAPFTSSYAHLPRTVGVAHTEFDAAVESEADLIAALAGGGPRRVVHLTGPRRWGTTVAELAHLCWENSWQKVDRLVFSDTEATHPDQAPYEGRFDDVSVY